MQQLRFVVLQVELNAVTRQMLDGREYLVAPVDAVREGVLNGHLLTAEDINNSTLGWRERRRRVGPGQSAQ